MVSSDLLHFLQGKHGLEQPQAYYKSQQLGTSLVVPV